MLDPKKIEDLSSPFQVYEKDEPSVDGVSRHPFLEVMSSNS